MLRAVLNRIGEAAKLWKIRKQGFKKRSNGYESRLKKHGHHEHHLYLRVLALHFCLFRSLHFFLSVIIAISFISWMCSQTITIGIQRVVMLV